MVQGLGYVQSPSLLILASLLIGLSLFLFLLMGMDKSRAQKGAYRIPEKHLLLLGFFGGGPGGLVAMKIFRHKTLHWYFWFVFGLGSLLDLGLLLWVWKGGA